MKVRSDQIEAWAVNEVKEVFLNCKNFQPCISCGDKEPVWDGFLYLHSESKEIKRIPIQVKGKMCKSLPKKTSYPVRVTDLKNYLHDGGVLYCVVYIVEKGDEREKFLHYAKLAPVDLKRFIKEANGQATISIPLRPFNKDGLEMEVEMTNFYNACKKQTSFVDAPIMSVEDAIQQGYCIKFDAHYLYRKNCGTSPLKEPVYLYAEIANVDYPIGDQAYPVSGGPYVKGDVVINGKIYYNEYLMTITGDEFAYCVYDMLRLPYRYVDEKIQPLPTQITSSAKTLSSKIHELSFILDLITFRKVSFGETVVVVLKDVPQKDIERVSVDLDYWKKARELFDRLHITEDVEIGKFSEEDMSVLTMLIDAILESKPVANVQDVNSIALMNIGQYKIFLLVEQNNDGTYMISNFFEAAEKNDFAYLGGNGERLKTSMFSVVFNHPGFEYFSNVDYSNIIATYEDAFQCNPMVCERANNDMLMALKAYDSKEEQDENLYNAIVALNDWLIERNSKYESIHLVNKYQIIRRKRPLKKEEKKDLLNILSDEGNGAAMKTAIHLLLGNKTMADFSYEEMDTAQQKIFDEQPISRFMNGE